VSFLPGEAVQTDVFTLRILVLLHICLRALEDDLTLCLGSLLISLRSRSNMKLRKRLQLSPERWYKKTSSPEDSSLDASRYHQRRPCIFSMHRVGSTFLFSERSASRSSWVFSLVLRFLRSDSVIRTWSFVGTVLHQC